MNTITHEIFVKLLLASGVTQKQIDDASIEAVRQADRMYTCTTCKEVKDLSMFHASKILRCTGKVSCCIACACAAGKAHYHAKMIIKRQLKPCRRQKINCNCANCEVVIPLEEIVQTEPHLLIYNRLLKKPQ